MEICALLVQMELKNGRNKGICHFLVFTSIFFACEQHETYLFLQRIQPLDQRIMRELAAAVVTHE